MSDKRAFDPGAALRGIRERLKPGQGARRTKHPGSKKGAVHVYRGKGHVWKAVTRPRRKSWNHLSKQEKR